MRVLFLLLLLVNLLFLAWIRWVAPTEVTAQAVPSAAAGKLQPIRLQREPVTAASPADPELGSTAAAAIAAATCVSVGPFASLQQAAVTSAALQRLGFATHAPRAATDEVRVGSWVRVPNLATPEDAANALASLQAAGLTDAYVVAEGEPGNAVSVGVFADPARAAEVAMTRDHGRFHARNQRPDADARRVLARHRPAGQRQPACARRAARRAER